MSDTAAGSTRRRSGKSADSNARASAIERLKAIREAGGRRSAAGVDFQVKLEQPIYDTVEEEDYARLVARRRETAKDFIVDDDGMGYGDEGEEEDWAQSGLPPSSDEDEGEEQRKTRKKKAEKQQAKVKDQPVQPKRPAPTSLSAAAAMMGKDRLSALFTSSVWKNERSKGGSSSDSIVDDLIAEITVDESDREARRRRRGLPPAQLSHVSASQPIPPPNGSFQAELPLPQIHEDRATVTEPPVPIFQDEDGGVDMDLLENGHFASVENGNVKMEEEKVTDQKVEVLSNGTVPASIKEVKQELAVPKPEKEVCLNAKIGTNDNLISATDGWKAICEGDKRADVSEVMTIQVNDEKAEFILDSDGSFPFYMIDAYEEPFGANAGIVYLFGKVKSKVGNAYHSCCVIVKNMQRCVYAIPNSSVFQNNKMTELETELANSKITASEFHAKLQEMASELKTDIAEKLLDLNVSNFSMMPVKRNYAFERSDIPTGEQYVLKINYPFKDRALSADLKGDSFHALLGVNSSALELFLIKRKIKGPSWLSISKFSNPQQRVSWCKIEVIVDSSKDIHVSTSKMVLEIPPLLVASLNLKTKINEKHSTNEIVSASVICCNKAKIDGPMIASEWERPGVLSHFTVIRKLEGGIFPVGFNKDVDDRNLKAGLTVLALESSERALLNRLMIELHKLDVDVLVGHNISGFDLDVLLHRSQACKVPSSMWSKIGRLKRSVMPKLTKGSTRYGSGASPGLMSCIAGRLLCDTYVCSKDLLKEVSYSLTQLAKTQLNKDRKEVNPHDIPSMFQASQSLLELVEYGETDAWLSMALMFRLSILPLTRQLTNISGNSWGKTLQGARAQRVEYLLLHAFHAKKYIVPDKNLGKLKDSDATKRKLNTDMKGDAEEIIDGDVTLDNDMQHAEQGKSRKGPAYAGGLVLEPKKGLYEKIVLLLDFNSLYPSIIQEYNICFTTVERTGASSTLPSSRTMGVLPELLKNLVERRRMVKSWLKSASGLKVQQLDIQQQALKLTANSMYGCLGFSSSRFYAKPIAELITSQGREILQSTVDLVQNVLNLEVIYGDTDSIMIYSGLDDIANAKEMAGKVIREVNKKYRCLEIDLDGLYKRMLLLKKKKYAAVKIHIKDGKPCEIIERRGLDIVRRDWSILSKELGDFCLSQILSGGSCEDVVEIIHSTLMKKQEEMRNGEIELEKYIITKSLTKPPEEYPDGRNQPHVQVAMRLKQSGYTSGFSPGDTVPYIICCEPGAHSSAGIADRARHPDELKRDSGNWMIDIDYYLSQQIHPVVSRLCASIQGTSPARLADCLGLDSSKFQRKVSEPTSRDPSSVLVSVLDDDNRYDGCEPLRLTCPSCSSSFECPPVSSLVQNLLNGIAPESDGNKNPESNFWQKIRCSRCPEDMDASRISSAIIANQVKRQAEHFLSIYYKGLMTCDDELCKYTTRIVNLRVIGDSERGTVCPNYPRCNGHLVRQFAEPDLYKQLSYFCHIFDTKQCLEKLDKDARLHIEKELSRIVPVIDSASATIQKIRDQCSYGWVQLQDLIILA